ncbi:McrC family protein [Methylophilus medardicus]|uniref:Restriction endonuclease n=1 Tax=Methylophilus medardicus TaxID=2588534 RepID=A0A5B8CTM3_9PROT|nr:McrC family protein [Methylophilus medardicus]QDC44579.1 restriction endonuclease [Methylophilus medardicus]QDC49586.1 restriction endonuclease [Methylophilus medardicus]QDC53291.1 restriction endonuclease [Methylophilus medardicus]
MIQVRERALITSSQDHFGSLDLGIVSQATYNWLLELHASWNSKAPILQQNGKQFLRLNSYVGILQSPTGEVIEILPKTQEGMPSDPELTELRQLMQRMLMTALSLKPRESGRAALDSTNTPIHEWIFAQFLGELLTLYRKGLKHDYVRVEEDSRFIRGQIDLTKQLRKSPDKSNWFNIRHDVYSPERIENKLLKTAVMFILKLTKSPQNWRFANELSHYLAEIPSLLNPEKYVAKWQHNRFMLQYEHVFPWCEIIIQNFNPSFQVGSKEGISFLFSMEKLFEIYVATNLSKQISKPNYLKVQASSQYFVNHQPLNNLENQNWFQLQPDLMVVSHDQRNVLDTKWKLLNSKLNSSNDKYQLSQGDFYQLFAYGHKYMGGQGHMMLIYPAHKDFMEPLSIFSFNEELHLWVVPFDLVSCKLVSGTWNIHIPIH